MKDETKKVITLLKDACLDVEDAETFLGDCVTDETRDDIVVYYFDDCDSMTFYYYLHPVGDGKWEAKNGSADVDNNVVAEADLVAFAREQQKDYDAYHNTLT